jgi:hypothetical protein
MRRHEGKNTWKECTAKAQNAQFNADRCLSYMAACKLNL